jgi:hypothetical protein
MLFNLWELAPLGALLASLMGFILGLSFGTLLSALLRSRRRYALDGTAGTAGFLAGFLLHAMSTEFAIEVNGEVVGWQAGASWPRLRRWVFGHEFLTEIVACVVCIALGRALAGAAAQLTASRARRNARPPA